MASKRMISNRITDSDAFIEMPLSSQCLYFHLNMNADDDGFVDNYKKIMRCIGASEDDLKILIAKRFLLTFESGVIVIKHWRIHNTLSKGRYHETTHLEEKGMLRLKENNAYSFEKGVPLDDTRLLTMFDSKSGEQAENKRRTNGEQVENADKNSIDKNSIDKNNNNILSSKHDNPYEEIINYLNQKTGKSFKASTKNTQGLINARLKEGFSVDDFKKVIDVKCEEWGKDKKYSQYLQPSTLFAPSHFESYLQQALKSNGQQDNEYGIQLGE